MKKIAFTLTWVLVAFVCSATKIIYVNATKSFAGDGTTWKTAYSSTELQKAINEASNETNTEIWISGGTLKAETATGFAIPDNITIRGGFYTNQTSPNDREKTDADKDKHLYPWEFKYKTFVDNISVDGTLLQNYMTISGDNVLIDGIHFTNFRPNNAVLSRVPVSITNAEATLKKCAFYNDTTDSYASAIYATTSNVSLEQCYFANNKCDSKVDAGGATYFKNCRLHLFQQLRI